MSIWLYTCVAGAVGIGGVIVGATQRAWSVFISSIFMIITIIYALALIDGGTTTFATAGNTQRLVIDVVTEVNRQITLSPPPVVWTATPTRERP